MTTTDPAAGVREPPRDAAKRGIRAALRHAGQHQRGVTYLGIRQGAAYQASADYNDLTIEYGHYLRDAKGHTAKLYTTWSFTERALSMIPEGAGDVTGIVNKRYKCDMYDGRDEMRRPVESWCVRIRRESDVTNFETPAASRLSKTVMQIGPWTDNKGAMQTVTASVGRGQLKHSVGVEVLGSTSGNTQQMYLAWLTPAAPRRRGMRRRASGFRPTATPRACSTSP